MDLVREEFQKLPAPYRDRALELLSDPARQSTSHPSRGRDRGFERAGLHPPGPATGGGLAQFGKQAASGQIRGPRTFSNALTHPRALFPQIGT